MSMYKFFLLMICMACSWLEAAPLPCFDAIEKDFFSYDVVAQACSLNLIYQPYWVPVYKTLKANSKQLKNRYEQKLSRIVTTPNLTIETSKQLIFESLYEIFVLSCLENRLNNDPLVFASMFRYIATQHNYMVNNCWGTLR